MSDIKLRKATEADTELTFKWASDPVVRAFSFNTKPILFDEHSQWFKKKVKDLNCYYYIASVEGEAIGSIRYDIVNNEAVMSILIDPAFHGKGLSPKLFIAGGDLMVKNITEGNLPAKQIVGYVLSNNIASQKSLLRAGYALESKKDETLKFVRLI